MKTSNRDVEVFLPSAEASMRFAFSQLSRLPPGGVKWPNQSPSGGRLNKKRGRGPEMGGPPGGPDVVRRLVVCRCFVALRLLLTFVRGRMRSMVVASRFRANLEAARCGRSCSSCLMLSMICCSIVLLSPRVRFHTRQLLPRPRSVFRACLCGLVG